MAKLLKETYKTYEGARKRAAFENGLAFSEFRAGFKARHYSYRIIADGDCFRVQRYNKGEQHEELST